MIRSIALWMAAALAVPAFAQQARPPSVNALETLPRVARPAPRPRVQLTVQTHQRATQLQALLATPVTPTHINVSGVHAIPFARVAALFQPLVGKHVHIRDLLVAAKACQRLYRKAGYALSFCYVPMQAFAHGVVTIVAVEGHVTGVQFEGHGAGTLRRKILQITRPLLRQRPLRTATFQRVVQLLGMLPGAKIKANVPAPTTTGGATRLLLTVTRRRFDTSYGVDFNHPGIAGILKASSFGLTPLAERIDAGVLVPHGHQPQNYYTFGYAEMLGGNGLTLQLNGSRFTGNPDVYRLLPAYLRHHLTQDQASGALSYPLWLDAHHSFTLSGRVYGTNQDDHYLNLITGAELGIDTRVRAARIGARYVRAYPNHTTAASFSATHGFGFAGAGQSLSSNIPLDALSLSTDTDFIHYNASVTQSDTWGAHIGTVVGAIAQYSPDSLPSSEQIDFGGGSFAQAYDPGSTAGDSGWGVMLELNRRFDLAKALLREVTPFVQADAARAYLHGAQPVIRSLASFVIGVRLSDRRHYTVAISAAQPMGDPPLGQVRRHPRFDLTLAYKLD